MAVICQPAGIGDALRPEFWRRNDPVMLPPPGLPAPEGMERLPLPDGAVVFNTSGSTGEPKWLVLTRAALLASATSVCDWLGITSRDRLLCPLPGYHVGGFGMAARAWISGAAWTMLPGRWDAPGFTAYAADWRATVTSLVPAQVFDLVKARVQPPSTLRLAVVGGGHLAADLESEARQLGWPVLASFGMTEAGSQVATERQGIPAPGPGWLPVLDCWEAAADGNGLLRLRGSALFSGRVSRKSGRWSYEPAPLDADGWFTTADLVETSSHHGRCWLHPHGRNDDAIKIRGELVSLSNAAREVEGLARGMGLDPARIAMIDLDDPRTGKLLALVGDPDAAPALDLLRDAFNRRAPAYARVERLVVVPHVPRSPLGKLQRTQLRVLLQGADAVSRAT